MSLKAFYKYLPANLTLTLICYLKHYANFRIFKEFKMKKFILLISALSLTTVALTANAYSGEKLAKTAKVTIAEARVIALNAHPGKIVDEELEKEGGGSGLRYSFDIRHDKVTQEVGVDAQTGKVLENKPEGAHPD